MKTADLQAIAKHNVRRFILFRMLFNARFYYPVFAVIFLDFGLSLDQFALLNAIWAATIILAEVPSGALSDLMGRKKLLMLTASLMVLEMSVWAFAPRGNPTLLFWLLALNRVLSGLGEASASGSDEALVYESLEDAGMKDQWSHVLERTSRWQSVAFMVAMVTGGLVYDPDLLGRMASIDRETTLRLPLYLTLATAIVCWINCLGFVEAGDGHSAGKPSITAAFRQTFNTGLWILKTPLALVVILAGAFLDSIIRMFVTLNSEYYRLIEYPEYALGILGTLVAAMNFFIAPLARRLVEKHPPGFVFLSAAAAGLLGFFGMSFFIPYAGLAFSLLLFATFSVVTFSLSFYLNQLSDKSMRATVLSFKGMALNLGYGFIGVVYAQLLRALARSHATPTGSDELFIEGAQYFTPYFLIGSLAVILFACVCRPNMNRLSTTAPPRR
ncbi:MFS transporter [Pontiella sp.]|uniref:MFS transporter n=1 Tax=Pontiella sp. TaxID=2837462 RepID=UPI0035653BDA